MFQRALLVFKVLILIVNPIISARQKGNFITYENITTTFNPNNTKFFSMTISPNSHGRAFDLLWNTTINIPNELHADIDMKIFDTNKNSFSTIFVYDFDLCRLWDGFMSQTIARMWFKGMKRFGNFPMECPIAKGSFYLKNMSIGKGGIPKFVPSGRFLSRTLMYHKRGQIKEKLFETISIFRIKLS